MLVDEKGKEDAECPCCMKVMYKPTQGCSEGHVLCLDCYTTWVETTKSCPTCRRSTDASRYNNCGT